MSDTVLYMAYDPESNTEVQVSEFDPALLQAATDAGIVFIAQRADGSRHTVNAADVKPYKAAESSVTLVQPVYVDERMQAIVGVFDALETLLFPEAAPLGLDNEDTGADPRDPFETFKEKLSTLRTITKDGESQ